MALCERCGKDMPDTAAICPSCGTAASISRPGTPSPTTYGQNPPSTPSSPYVEGYSQPYGQNPPSSPSSYYAQGYSQQYGYSDPPPQPQPQQGYAQPQGGYAQQQIYGQPYQVQPVAININMPVAAPVAAPNSAATVVEVLLTIFLGIYGVGWLMAGETTAGIILLICSIILYWPILILGTIFTLGFGLICLVPLGIGAIILNAILLSNTVKRKATYVLVQPMQPMQPFPPR